MKIAILTSGILPVPAVKGGAVENLTDFYLAYNEQHRQHDITVYSIADKATKGHPALTSAVNHYHYIRVTSLYAKIRKHLLHCFYSKNEYYHYSIEYFLHEAITHICRQHYDVIIMENRPGYALKLKEKTDARLVYHLHNDILNSRTAHARKLYDAAARIMTVSDYIKSCVQTIEPADSKTNTVHNGIDLTAFSQNNTVSRADKGLHDDDFVIVFSGRVNREKGILQLVEAMMLLKDYTHVRLFVIGSSFYGNDNNENEFARTLQTKAAPLKDRITFTGFIPYQQMPGYLHLADVAVIPSVWDDPFPTTVLEAQAMGLPVIATRRGGIPEEVTPETAILLHTDEHFTDNLAQAILDLYQHPEKRKNMSEAALAHSKYYNQQRYAEDFFAAIEQN